MLVYSSRDMKSGLVGKHGISQKVGVCGCGQACHMQNCVAIGCPLVSAPAESAYYTHRNTTAFAEPYAQLLVASAVPMKPDELTSPDERPTDVLYLLIGDTLPVSSVPFQDAPSLQKLVVSCFDRLCVWCFFLLSTKLSLHPHSGLSPELTPYLPEIRAAPQLWPVR
jgi:hypothetical protein